jgi:Ca2+/Na+ antiporter
MTVLVWIVVILFLLFTALFIALAVTSAHCLWKETAKKDNEKEREFYAKKFWQFIFLAMVSAMSVSVSLLILAQK